MIPGRPRASGSTAKDSQKTQDDQLHDGPADEGGDGRDIEVGAASRNLIPSEDAPERRHEDVAQVIDEGYQVVSLARRYEQEHDTQDEQALDEREEEDDQPFQDVGPAGTVGHLGLRDAGGCDRCDHIGTRHDASFIDHGWTSRFG